MLFVALSASEISLLKESRKADVLVATKMNISSIEVHSLMRVWNG